VIDHSREVKNPPHIATFCRISPPEERDQNTRLLFSGSTCQDGRKARQSPLYITRSHEVIVGSQRIKALGSETFPARISPKSQGSTVKKTQGNEGAYHLVFLLLVSALLVKCYKLAASAPRPWRVQSTGTHERWNHCNSG
jgi:hypothetical protein